MDPDADSEGPKYEKPDFDFQVKKQFMGYDNRAARMAVFSPIVGRDWLSHGKAGVEQTTFDVQRKWRKLVDDLVHEDMVGLTPRRAFQWRNCRPFGIEVDRDAWYCFQRNICPFCYGRKVLEAYRHLRDFLFSQVTDVHTVQVPNIAVVGFRTNRAIRPPPKTTNMSDTVLRLAMMRDVSHVIRYDREVEYAFTEAIGGLVDHSFHFDQHWDFSAVRFGVLIVPVQLVPLVKQLDGEQYANGLTTVTCRFTILKGKEITKGALSKMMGQYFRYPSCVFKNPAVDIIRMLSFLRRMRMTTKYGILRDCQKHLWSTL